MPSTLRPTRLPPAVDEAKAMTSVSGHHEAAILEVSDCEHAYEARVSEQWLRLVDSVGLSMTLVARGEASSSYCSDSWHQR